ncbi:hypothetical protein H6G11_14535 [Cyanobacterium aponinum FACHB-4101]|uniref:hypothetical protein n=1 Tax=Cyanobacterium aponinum TaxID=379064 RepID=UPI00168194B8|nr:hypothetical protein [Cyanobacterium aponinum]MBD2395467.1 hypothetical protein [Cyanobacterium aponinum FACHB-4101]
MTMGLETIASSVIIALIAKTKEKAVEKLIDISFDQIGETIKAIYQNVKKKLQQADSVSLLERVEKEPTEKNQKILEAKIINQMKDDETFAQTLEELVKQLNSELPDFQSVLENALIEEIETGKITMENEGKPQGKQIFGKGLKVGGKAKFGDITITNRSHI